LEWIVAKFASASVCCDEAGEKLRPSFLNCSKAGFQAYHVLAAIAARQRLLHIPIDRHCNEDDRNDPKNDVFATAFFLGHARQYNTSEIPVQVAIEFLGGLPFVLRPCWRSGVNLTFSRYDPLATEGGTRHSPASSRQCFGIVLPQSCFSPSEADPKRKCKRK
jgi:hypothetical protein